MQHKSDKKTPRHSEGDSYMSSHYRQRYPKLSQGFVLILLQFFLVLQSSNANTNLRILHWRGGATTRQSRPTINRLETSHPQKRQQSSLPSVQAILIPRKVNLLQLIRIASLGCVLMSFISCMSDAGTPFKESIWSALHDGHMPVNYKPSNWELLLTLHSTLPPPYLPSVQPLLAMLSSLVMFVGLGLLLPNWFESSYRRWLEFREVDQDNLLLNPSQQAAVVVHLPREMRVYAENRALQMCALHISEQNKHYFDLFHQRYYMISESGKVAFGGPTLTNSPVKTLLNQTGLCGTRLQQAKSEFESYNKILLPTPTVSQAVLSRLSSPLVVLQLFGKLLAALEHPSFVHTIMSLTQTLLHHYWNARQSIVSARELAQDVQRQDGQTITFKVQRGFTKKNKKKWIYLNATALLPGDVIQIDARQSSAQLMFPVDALLLQGSAVTNEAVLTGESVAQSKVALQEDDAPDNNNDTLDILGRHRMSVVFAGTTLVHCPGPITLLVLRTGSYSSRGDLLRALQRSRVGAVSNVQTEQDGLGLLASLGIVACMCCSWYWKTHPQDALGGLSIFRKVLQCSRIILAAIPSDLPMALSAIAHTCALRLKHDADVVCSEPGSLLSASTVDHVIFDKTGTICSDTQSMSHVANATTYTDIVLAGSNSLVQVNKSLVGDPLDTASLFASGWTLNSTSASFEKEGRRMWQIKAFPFDANRRTSSSLVLIQDVDGNKQLYALTKGSPDAILNLASSVDEKSFQKDVGNLGRDGYRIIALGMKEISQNSSLFQDCFPKGFSNKKSIERIVDNARKAAEVKLHRDSIETKGTLNFCGFACFEGSVRPSSPRVIRELLQANLGVTVLTGDGIDVSISVARRCQLIAGNQSVAVLDYKNEPPRLTWTIFDDTKNVTSGSSRFSTRKALSSKQSFALVATGNAIEALCKSQPMTPEEDMIHSRLMDFVVIARATPSQKVLVVSALKQIGKRVIMCGDGVNDVAAMKAADCGVALLNGFGDHHVPAGGNVTFDLEDERRRQRVLEKKLGSQRRIRPASNSKLGKSGQANRERVKELLDKELIAIKTMSAERRALLDPNSNENKLALDEIRETFDAIRRIHAAENERARLIRKGGAAAAKILAEDDRSLTGNTSQETMALGQDIKPGEASLVSPFSCLRPAIDGVEWILRYSVAASSFVHVMHKTIALNCLSTAFNLATVPVSRLRYGKFMWNVEFALYIFTEQAATRAACTPRPRLSNSRPPASFFHDPATILSVVAQFLVHATTRAICMSMATGWEKDFPLPQERRRLIRVAESASLFPKEDKKPMRALLLESLVSAPVESQSTKSVPAIVKLFQRAPFIPNYQTNVAFLLSVFQSGVSTLVNHMGRPFSGAVLEHRQFLIGIGLSILFPLCMITEGFKTVNQILELRLLPTTRSQLHLMGIFGIDFIASYLVSIIFKFLSSRRLEIDRPMSRPHRSEEGDDGGTVSPVSAAEQEELLLEEETQENDSFLRIMLSSIGMVYLSSLAKTLEAGVP